MLSKVFRLCASVSKWYTECRNDADAEALKEVDADTLAKSEKTFEEGSQWYPRGFPALWAAATSLIFAFA